MAFTNAAQCSKQADKLNYCICIADERQRSYGEGRDAKLLLRSVKWPA